MSKLLGVPVHVIYYRSEEITEIDMRAALVKDALPTLAVGVVTYNNHMQPSIN